MTKKKYAVVDDGFIKYIEDTTLTEDKHEGHINDAYALCRELNELYEENVQLRMEKNAYLQDIEAYKEENTHLKIENQQLKYTSIEVAELLEEEVDLFSDKAVEHDIVAYRELQDLDNKDACWMATATKKSIKMLKSWENK